MPDATSLYGFHLDAIPGRWAPSAKALRHPGYRVADHTGHRFLMAYRFNPSSYETAALEAEAHNGIVVRADWLAAEAAPRGTFAAVPIEYIDVDA